MLLLSDEGYKKKKEREDNTSTRSEWITSHTHKQSAEREERIVTQDVLATRIYETLP